METTCNCSVGMVCGSCTLPGRITPLKERRGGHGWQQRGREEGCAGGSSLEAAQLLPKGWAPTPPSGALTQQSSANRTRGMTHGGNKTLLTDNTSFLSRCATQNYGSLSVESRHYSKSTELPKNQSNITAIFLCHNQKAAEEQQTEGQILKGI